VPGGEYETRKLRINVTMMSYWINTYYDSEKIQSHNSYGVVSCTGMDRFTRRELSTTFANIRNNTQHINQETSLVVDILAASYKPCLPLDKEEVDLVVEGLPVAALLLQDAPSLLISSRANNQACVGWFKRGCWKMSLKQLLVSHSKSSVRTAGTFLILQSH
jgi:hypothetical protein